MDEDLSFLPALSGTFISIKAGMRISHFPHKSVSGWEKNESGSEIEILKKIHI